MAQLVCGSMLLSLSWDETFWMFLLIPSSRSTTPLFELQQDDGAERIGQNRDKSQKASQVISAF